MNHTNKAAADTRPQKGMNNTCGSVFVSVFVSIFVSIFVSVFLSKFAYISSEGLHIAQLSDLYHG